MRMKLLSVKHIVLIQINKLIYPKENAIKFIYNDFIFDGNGNVGQPLTVLEIFAVEICLTLVLRID